MKIFSLLAACFIFCFSSPIDAQFNTKINLESGVSFDLLNDSNKTSSIHKIFGNFKYKNKRANSETSLSFKFRPQFFDNSFHSIKLGGTGTFLYNSDIILWKSYLSLLHHNYDLSLISSYYSTFTFINGIEFDILKDTPFDFSLGYSYQDINFDNSAEWDMVFMDSKINNYYDQYLSWSYGLFVERYDSESKLKNTDKLYKTIGWRYGPQIQLRYLKSFLFDVGYKFLFYNSDNLANPSYEHQINFLSGIVINKKFSLFLLIDFFIVRTKLKDELDNLDEYLFIPTKNENQIYIKTAYKFSKKSSVYLKFGYFRENLYLDSSKLDGLNLLLGIELKI